MLPRPTPKLIQVCLQDPFSVWHDGLTTFLKHVTKETMAAYSGIHVGHQRKPKHCFDCMEPSDVRGNVQQILNMLLVQQMPPSLPMGMEPAVKDLVADALQHEAFSPMIVRYTTVDIFMIIIYNHNYIYIYYIALGLWVIIRPRRFVKSAE